MVMILGLSTALSSCYELQESSIIVQFQVKVCEYNDQIFMPTYLFLTCMTFSHLLNSCMLGLVSCFLIE